MIKKKYSQSCFIKLYLNMGQNFLLSKVLIATLTVIVTIFNVHFFLSSRSQGHRVTGS